MIDTLADDLDFPEGPAFDREGKLWCVELHGGNLVRFDGERVERHATQGAPNGLAFDYEGRAVFCDAGQNSVRRFDVRTDEFETLVRAVDGEPLRKPNDLAFDAGGNLIFTCPGDSRREPTGYVCCRRVDGRIEKIADGLYFPNGLAFTDEGRTLVIAETYRQRLWRGSWDADECAWMNTYPWADVGGAPGPDGVAFDANNLLYVAVYGSSEVKVVDERGQVFRTHRLPGANPTNVAFDPTGTRGLVVTEAERGLLLSFPGIQNGTKLFDGSTSPT